MPVPDDFKKMQDPAKEVLSLELSKLQPLVIAYVEDTAEELSKAFGADQLQLLKLSRALALRFINEYLSLADKSQQHKPEPSSASKALSNGFISCGKCGSRLSLASHAALRVQAAWRKHQTRRRLHRNLLSMVFEESPTPRSSLHLSGAPALGLREQRSKAASDRVSQAVRSVRVVRRAVTKVMARLKQHGLDLASAFRAANSKSYPEVEAAMPVGQYMVFLMKDQRLSLLPAEQTVLMRLFQAPGHRNRDKESAKGEAALAEAEMKYTHVLELAHVFRVSSELVEKDKPWKAPLEAVRDALVEAGRRDGRSSPSWIGLLLDAHVSHLLEERARLKATLDDEERHQESKVLEVVKHQLAVCAAQLSAAGKPGASPRVAVPIVIARLLQDGLKGIAPVTIHAAVHVASETRCERRGGQLRLRSASSENSGPSGFVEFDAPLPAAPSLLHLALDSEDHFEVDLESLSASGMCLLVRPRSLPSGQHSSRGLSSKLRVCFQAGAARGTARVSSAGRTEVTFLPHLGRVPPYVLLETLQASGKADASAQVAVSSGILGLGLLVKRPTKRGFTFVLPRKDSINADVAISYEAVSMEPAVTAERLQELAELPGRAADAEREVAQRIPEEVLREASGVLQAPDDLEGDAEVGAASSYDSEDTEVDEEEDQYMDLMNRRALHRLGQTRATAHLLGVH